MKKGTIHLIPFPFTDLSQKKIRPCLVLARDRTDSTVVFITSIKPKGSEWIKIIPSKENGIKSISYIRYTKIATLDSALSIGSIGELEPVMFHEVKKKIRAFLEV